MNALFERIAKNLYTTVTGLVAGAATGAVVTFQSGAVTKEALIAGAAVGFVGALLKDPQWLSKLGARP